MSDKRLLDNLEKIGVRHFSYSSGSSHLARFIFNYVHRSAEDRRKDVIGEAGAIGTAVHTAVQENIAHGIDIDDAIKAAVIYFDEHPACEDLVKRERFREVIAPMSTNLVEILHQSGFTNCEEEHKFSVELPDIALPVIGFVDLVGDGIFAEIKTKCPVKTRKLKDGSQGWGKGRIPASEPEHAHVMQAALYQYAMGLTPSICYTAEHEAKIFTPFNCKSLQQANLDRSLEEFRQKLLMKQNLIRLSPDAKKLASIVDPEWSHIYIWKIDDELRKEAKNLWQL